MKQAAKPEHDMTERKSFRLNERKCFWLTGRFMVEWWKWKNEGMKNRGHVGNSYHAFMAQSITLAHCPIGTLFHYFILFQSNIRIPCGWRSACHMPIFYADGWCWSIVRSRPLYFIAPYAARMSSRENTRPLFCNSRNRISNSCQCHFFSVYADFLFVMSITNVW